MGSRVSIALRGS